MKILKNKLLFLFCFIFLMIPSVNAEAEYYDDEGNPFRLIFDETPLRNFVKNDFALTYNYINSSNQLLAVLSKQDGSNTAWAGYVYTQPLMIQIYETSTEYQNSTNIKYIVNVTPDVTVGSSTNYAARINWISNMVTKKNDGYYTIKGKQYRTNIAGMNYLVYGKIGDDGAGIIEYGYNQEAYGGLFLTVDTKGNVQRIINLYNNSTLSNVAYNSRNNLIYSSTDIYNNGGSVIIKKEEFIPKRNTPHADYSLGCDENNPFIYNIYFNIDFLEKNDNVKIYKEDKLLKDIKYVYDPEETETITIENAETGYYKIDVYDENNQLLYSATFHINVEIGDIFDENDTPITLLDKIKTYLKGFKNNIVMFYEGFENFFSSLNFELRTGIFIITTIFIIVYIIKIIL